MSLICPNMNFRVSSRLKIIYKVSFYVCMYVLIHSFIHLFKCKGFFRCSISIKVLIYSVVNISMHFFNKANISFWYVFISVARKTHVFSFSPFPKVQTGSARALKRWGSECVSSVWPVEGTHRPSTGFTHTLLASFMTLTEQNKSAFHL